MGEAAFRLSFSLDFPFLNEDFYGSRHRLPRRKNSFFVRGFSGP